jgi:NAD(P)-dependent dehydrogenase (short-subunit alcohol dehydrogenase family)
MFAAQDATVIGVDRDDCDVTDEAAVARLIAMIATEHGRLDILVNAAATALFKWIQELSYAEWRSTITAELDSVFLVTRAAWPLLKASGHASVINFASANARHALEGSPALAHVAGKGGVLAMTRQLAMEGAPHGIRANSISPGFIQTAATTAHLKSDPGFREKVLAKNMIKRLGTPADVAHCATWLASDEAGYVTGADIAIDAGATAW